MLLSATATLFKWGFPVSSGTGGLKWATCAAVAGDYLSGTLSRTSFIDRCWTLEHNGGSAFNKIYLWASAHRHHLRNVLDTQEQEPYSELVKWGSEEVQK